MTQINKIKIQLKKVKKKTKQCHVQYQLTCLCLYSNRHATIWVDMIAEDLFAAVRDKSKTKDPIFRLMTMLNLISCKKC